MQTLSAGLKRDKPLPRQSFTKADRLLHRSEFIDLAKSGKRFKNRHFIAYVEKSQYHRCRLGITVTRKVGNAVTRNRIKRLAREHFRQNRQKMKNPWDINLIAQREAADISNKSICLSLDNIFVRIASYQYE